MKNIQGKNQKNIQYTSQERFLKSLKIPFEGVIIDLRIIMELQQ